ncbi:SRPBCC family protein [Phytomonospora sp. NPDC050363]|uniref:SRPBCC family protein n=1 Tax=Phytomonospora sp. NPDC050363 TaxID=3155642 RepID=UPI0033E5BE7C
MWTFSHTETTTATPARLWEHYADPPSWPRWDPDTAEVTVDGPFSAGTTGTLKPIGGPRVHFELTEVTPQRSFTDVARLPLTRLTFAHDVEPHGRGARFTHTVTFDGPLAWLFRRVIGRGIAAGMPEAMSRLAALAAAGER